MTGKKQRPTVDAASFIYELGREEARTVCEVAGIDYTTFRNHAAGRTNLSPDAAERLEVASNFRMGRGELLYPNYALVCFRPGKQRTDETVKDRHVLVPRKLARGKNETDKRTLIDLATSHQVVRTGQTAPLPFDSDTGESDAT
ncbi:hypothetical protein E2P84_36695 [Burkholderia cepacia]|uniref:Uncharacterized protein n=1 Tax=Burkholderia cepacia TaxID=292 RepID=A0AAX2RQJ7_BURCE|nr:hypothetical protein [Burkholderia cepacia]TES65670.1 hypothetical protein E2P84_36695 [Burkholderia cepacia]TET01674.1 hypothetical protein E3D36_16700 [Burkholderia cepacia]TEU47532.1 hypothetical protein E3D37_16130 [Burkholderia cepacia]TEU53559.1 hypothetical protein E3D38_12520 [Burkholderia cepacia]TEV02165.1 hypothetical protein E3D40_13450 [Burkholderia cepacia]